MEFVEAITDEQTFCADYQFIHILRDTIAECLIHNNIYQWGDDIDDAKGVIFPIVFNIVFNSNFDIRHNSKAINELIKFLISNYA